ncbi:MAG: TetR/AcrR family transcriptional regulator [Solirubrobacterales bacterium]
MSGSKRRDQILEKARHLFNLHSASATTTNHIAAEMGISPGNLYYYFSNKEEIVRELFEQMYAQMTVMWETPGFHNSEEGILEFSVKLSALMVAYRFTFKELNALVKRDPLLRESFSAKVRARHQMIIEIFDTWVAAGIMKPFVSSLEKEYMAQNAWLLGLMWITFAETIYNDLSPENIAKAAKHIYFSLRPQLHSASVERLDKLLYERYGDSGLKE